MPFFFLVGGLLRRLLWFSIILGHAFAARRMVPLCFVYYTVCRLMVPELGLFFWIVLCFLGLFFLARSGVFCVFLGIECFGGATLWFFVVCSVGVLVIGYHLASLPSWVAFLPRLCWRFPRVCGMMWHRCVWINVVCSISFRTDIARTCSNTRMTGAWQLWIAWCLFVMYGNNMCMCVLSMCAAMLVSLRRGQKEATAHCFYVWN